MASKSKDVRIEQRRILEKKLEMRLSKLTGQGIAAEKIKTDPLVKSLKSQIRETNIRIAAIDKNTVKVESMKQDKAKKLLEKAAPKEAAAPEKDAKSKKKAAPADKEPKKKKEPAADGEVKKPKKKKEEAPAQ